MAQELSVVEEELEGGLEEAMRDGWIPYFDWSDSLWEWAVGLRLALATTSFHFPSHSAGKTKRQFHCVEGLKKMKCEND